MVQVTDHAKRTFRDITGFQYAVWALDWQMWRMIKGYLSKEAAQEQSRGFSLGSWVKKNGEHSNWKELIEAQQTLIDNWQNWSRQKVDEHWVKQIGGTQLLLPMHALQEYAQPYPPFDPCPNFGSEYILGRNLTKAGLVGLGSTAGFIRGAANCVLGFRYIWGGNKDPVISKESVEADRQAMEALYRTRIRQRADLVAELTSDRDLSLSVLRCLVHQVHLLLYQRGTDPILQHDTGRGFGEILTQKN